MSSANVRRRPSSTRVGARLGAVSEPATLLRRHAFRGLAAEDLALGGGERLALVAQTERLANDLIDPLDVAGLAGTLVLATRSPLPPAAR